VLALLPQQVQLALALILYSGAAIGAAWFLLIGSRKPAPSQLREAFRRPGRVRALGYLLLAADAILFLASSGSKTWQVAVVSVGFGLGFLLTWVGHRMYSRAADAYPAGKHAGPVSPRESRWPLSRR